MGGNAWTNITLGEFVTLQRGHDLPEQDRRSGTVPILGSFGVTGWHDVAKAKGPGVTVGRSGASFGVVAFSIEDFWPLNTALYVIDFHGNDERFAYYFLKNFDFSGHNSGSAQPSLNRNYIHPLPVRVPPLAEQRAIAHILGTLDDKIELNRRTNETLEAMARALFKSWFVDFDPVRAKAAGRKPVGMDEATAALFPDAFEPSELGEIPRGWRVGTLADFASLNPEIWTKKSHPSHIRYVDISSTKWGVIHSIDVYDWDNAPSRAQRILRPGDTIIGTVRPGNGAYALIKQDGLTGSTGFAVLRPQCSHYREYVYLSSTIRSNISALEHLADGGAYPAVRPETVIQQSIICPTENVINAFSIRAFPMLDKILLLVNESEAIAELREFLLPRLLSGEFTITNSKI